MVSDARLDEPEPISPELVLVSPPEVAQVARDNLPEPRLDRATERPVAQRVGAFTRNGSSEPSAARERPLEPPRYPRVVVEEPPPKSRRRPRGGLVLAYLVLACFIGGAAFVLAKRHHARRTGAVAVVTPSPTVATKANPRTTTSPPHSKTPKAARAQRRATKRVRHAARPSVSTHAKRGAKTKHASHPKRSKPAGAPSASSFVPSRTWTWPQSEGARGYDMRFILNGHVVLRLRTTRPRVVLPALFRFRAGTYHWVVQRVPRPASRRPVVDSKFVLTPAAAAQANG